MSKRSNEECHYRHALPPRYILKSQMKALLEEEANKLAIEDEIEDQVKVVCGRLRSNSRSYMLAEEKTLYLLLKNYEQIGRGGNCTTGRMLQDIKETTYMWLRSRPKIENITYWVGLLVEQM
ncbi:hypothetical protein Hanom_Chr08g00715121 [Helianthus anomalus]